MADKKISQLTALTSPATEDLLVVVDDPKGTPVSKLLSLFDLFGNVPGNTTISGTTTMQANVTISGSNTVVSSNVTHTGTRPPRVNSGQITLGSPTTVGSNNPATVFSSGGMQVTIDWDANFLYVATSNTVLKRIALSTF